MSAVMEEAAAALDRELAATVRDSVHALNGAIERAAEAGLEIELDVVTARSIGERARPHVGVWIRRSVPL